MRQGFVSWKGEEVQDFARQQEEGDGSRNSRSERRQYVLQGTGECILVRGSEGRKRRVEASTMADFFIQS